MNQVRGGCSLCPNSRCSTRVLCFVLFGLRFNVPVKDFSVMSVQSHHLLGIVVNVSYPRAQHGAPSGNRSYDICIRSPAIWQFGFNFACVRPSVLQS